MHILCISSPDDFSAGAVTHRQGRYTQERALRIKTQRSVTRIGDLRHVREDTRVRDDRAGRQEAVRIYHVRALTDFRADAIAALKLSESGH